MKSILICRTSTSRQEIDNQIKETKDFALADGKREEDLILLAKHGASAIKIDKAYQENMERVYREIEAGGVDCVYAWALDRIGRNEVVMMQFKEFLVKHGVQLKIKNPALVLLNSDGTVNSGMEIAFTLYITLAKQEMEQKKARFERTRKAKLGKRQWTGGKVLYGYMVDENNHLIPNPQTAPLVQEAFALYATGEWGIAGLSERMRHRGWPKCSRKVLSYVLSNRSYLGEHKVFDCSAIIDEETFSACRKVASKKSLRIGHSKQHWLASKLITCPDCGWHFTAWEETHNKALFRCPRHAMKERGCPNDLTMNAYKIDPILFDISLPLEMRRLSEQTNVNKDVLLAKLNDLNKELDSRQTEYDKRVKKAVDRINDLYAEGVIDKEEWRERRAAAVAKADNLKAKIEKLQLEADRLQRQIDSVAVGGRFENIFGYNIAMSAEDVSQMVHRHILNIALKRLSDRENLVTVQTTLGDEKFVYTTLKRSNNWRRWSADGNHTPLSVPVMEKKEGYVMFRTGGNIDKFELTEEQIASLVTE